MSMNLEMLDGFTDARLSVLESQKIAQRITTQTGMLARATDHVIAQFENRLIEHILLRRLKKALRHSGNLGNALHHADQMRSAYEEGRMETLPSFQPSGHFSSTAKIGNTPDQDPDQSTKTARDSAVILYVVGGGFVMPPSKQQKVMVQRLAEATNCEVIIGTHRMAPEHPFPAAPLDIVSHYLTLLEQGFEPGQIFFAADTAGASVTLGAMQMLQQREIALPAGSILFSPWCDLGLTGWSYITGSMSAKSPFRMETAAFCARLYLQDTLATDPMVSPIYADFDGWPPMLIHTSENDMHFDDALRMAENGQKSGCDVRINYWDSPRHHLERLSSRDAELSFQKVARFIEEFKNTGGSGRA